MAKRFDLIVFDWDGTLMDSAGVIVDSLQKASADLDLAVPDERACRQIIGLGLAEALRALQPGLDAGRYPQMVERYRHHYLGRDADLPLFAGVAEGLPQLAAAGYTLAVATGKSRVGLARALDHSGLTALFATTRCADQTHSKPHPAMVEEILDELLVDKARALVIGDTSHDMLMAANAGVDRLAVSYGAHTLDDLLPHAPRHVAGNFAGVMQWLLK